MKLLMISGDRSLQHGRKGAFFGMLEEFSKHWERIDILCPTDGGSELDAPRPPFSPMDRVFVHCGEHRVLRQPKFIVRRGKELVAEHHHDVMTVHEYPPFYNGRGARRLSRMTGVPAVMEIHHLVGYPVPASMSERIGLHLSRWYLGRHAKGFRAVRTVNAGVKTILTEWGVDAKKIQIVPSVYLDHNLYQNLHDAEKKYDLVFCGRMVPNKGLMPVLDALHSLPGRTLLVIGDGPELPSAREYVLAAGLEHRVTFMGWLPESGDVMRAIATGRVFIMNSRSEGNPRVAVEAMAAGLPVISTRVGIMPDILIDERNGIFVDGSAASIVRAADTLLANPAKVRVMGEEATNVMEKFEKRHAIERYAEFLKGI